MNSRQAINLLKGLEQSLDDYCELSNEGKTAFRMAITALELFGNAEQLPSAQPEITDEQAIEHLQSTGWMQNHDKQMYEMGLKEQLADDSGSYDSLIPSAQPEHLVKESGNLVKGLVNDCISRQAAKDALAKFVPYAICDESTESYTNGLTDAYNLICQLPSVQTEKTQLSEEDATKDATFDCISREDAIDAVKHHMNNVSGGNDEYYIAHRHIIELLQIVPTAQPESRREWYIKGYRDAQRWIPVTERLPEEGVAVLTQAQFRYDVKFAVSARIDFNYWTGWGTRDINITAWMPLPEAYKEG